MRQKSPLNLEFPFSSLSDWLIPADQFYVRNHFDTPHIDADGWSLTVSGEQGNALDRLVLAQLDRAEALVVVDRPLLGSGRR